MTFRLSIGIRSSCPRQAEEWRDRIREEVRQAQEIMTDLRCFWYLDVPVFVWEVNDVELYGNIISHYKNRALTYGGGSELASITVQEFEGEKVGQHVGFDAALRRDQFHLFLEEVRGFVTRAMRRRSPRRRTVAAESEKAAVH